MPFGDDDQNSKGNNKDLDAKGAKDERKFREGRPIERCYLPGVVAGLAAEGCGVGAGGGGAT
jgi:hypothetical protein